MRSLRAETTLTLTQREAADLAPFSATSGEPQGDGLVDVRDLAVLARVLANQDVDGDSLAPSLERRLGLWPLLRDSDHDGTPDGDEDSDQDGLSNLAELVAGTDHVGIYVGGWGANVVGAGEFQVEFSRSHFLTSWGLGPFVGTSGSLVYRRYVGSGF